MSMYKCMAVELLNFDTLLGMNNSQMTEAVGGCTLSMCVCAVERLVSTPGMMIHTLSYIHVGDVCILKHNHVSGTTEQQMCAEMVKYQLMRFEHAVHGVNPTSYTV